MAEVGAVIQEDVLAEMALEDLRVVLGLDVRNETRVVGERRRGAVTAVVAVLRIQIQ